MSDFFRQHPHLLVAMYRSCFDLLRSGCFTLPAAHQAVRRYFSGYSVEEVGEAVAALVATGDLLCIEVEAMPHCNVFVAGPLFPSVDMWPEVAS